jgi:hypothetical protein
VGAVPAWLLGRGLDWLGPLDGLKSAGQRVQDLARPLLDIVLVLEVAGAQRTQPQPAQFLEPRVQVSRGLAEVKVARVAEAQDRENQPVQPGRGFRGQGAPESIGVVGHVPVSGGRGDDEHPAA